MEPQTAVTPLRTPETRIVTLADREADLYEYMLAARDRNLDAVVRARHKDRAF